MSCSASPKTSSRRRPAREHRGGLRRSARRPASGPLGLVLGVTLDLVIGVLVHSFNSMTAELQRNKELLEEVDLSRYLHRRPGGSPRFIVAVDGVTDPGNLGAIVRSILAGFPA